MILDEIHQFAFVHIPKCAGTTVREQISQFNATGADFSGIKQHPELGKLDYAHLPLNIVEDFFPDAFSKIQQMRCFAVVRDPNVRFWSALGQFLKMHRGATLSEASPEQIREALDKVLQEISKGGRLPGFPYIHFLPQHRFVDLGGSRIVKEIYPIEKIDTLLDELSRITGMQLNRQARSNQGLNMRFPKAAKIILRANDFAKGRLPYKSYQLLKRLGRPIVARSASNSSRLSNSEALTRKDVDEFVREYYAQDFTLYASAQERLRQSSMTCPPRNPLP